MACVHNNKVVSVKKNDPNQQVINLTVRMEMGLIQEYCKFIWSKIRTKPYEIQELRS